MLLFIWVVKVSLLYIKGFFHTVWWIIILSNYGNVVVVVLTCCVCSFQRTPSLRRKWRKRYGGLDGNKLLEPNKEPDMKGLYVLCVCVCVREVKHPVISGGRGRSLLVSKLSCCPVITTQLLLCLFFYLYFLRLWSNTHKLMLSYFSYVYFLFLYIYYITYIYSQHSLHPFCSLQLPS